MHLPMNLAEFVMSVEGCPLDERDEFVPTYERLLSRRDRPLKYKEHEYNDLRQLVLEFLARDVELGALDGFYYSYSIPHISKELDLLKVGTNMVLDIELKNCRITDERIQYQLERNAYYLSFLDKTVTTLTYCSEDGSWVELKDHRLIAVGWERAISCLVATKEFERCDLDALFVPKNYLVSPVMNFDAFMKRQYFLSGQQESIKKTVLAHLAGQGSGGMVVQGDSGTGKTLLLYDVALAMSEMSHKPALIFHGASLTNYHEAFNVRCREIEICRLGDLKSTNIGSYCFVGFDEAHRMRPHQFEAAMEQVSLVGVPFLVMLDPKQDAFKRNERNDVQSICERFVPHNRMLTLTKKFRTNATIADFIEAFVNNGNVRLATTEGIEVVYARTTKDAMSLVESFARKGFQYIALPTTSYAEDGLADLQLSGQPNAHGVIGLEYQKVVMIASHVHMEKGRLCDDPYPNPVLLPTRMLYQGLTRAQSEIALVVLDRWDVFQRAIELLSRAS